MTKRKAIETAMERWIEARRHRVAVDIEDVIVGSCTEKAYELGRIAGLREAARTCIISAGPNLNVVANKLAKKARKL